MKRGPKAPRTARRAVRGPKGPQPSAGARRKGAERPELLVHLIFLKICNLFPYNTTTTRSMCNYHDRSIDNPFLIYTYYENLCHNPTPSFHTDVLDRALVVVRYPDVKIQTSQ